MNINSEIVIPFYLDFTKGLNTKSLKMRIKYGLFFRTRFCMYNDENFGSINGFGLGAQSLQS